MVGTEGRAQTPGHRDGVFCQQGMRGHGPNGWAPGQGVNRDEEETKGREVQQSGWRSEGLRPGSN